MKQSSCLALVFALLAIACTGTQPEASDQSRANVILISIDTLRPDHLGCYGYEPATSPRLDEFCADSVVYTQAIAQAPSTLHSHASMLSSLLPHHHRASWSAKTRLSESVTSLPEVLREAGYQTTAFTGGGQMDKVFGLDQGFDSYVQPGEERFDGTVLKAIEWLEVRDDRPFFLFLHSYEPHHPYAPAEQYLEMFESDYEGSLPDEISVDLLREINRDQTTIDDRDLKHIIATYDAEIRSMDDGFQRLIAFLQDKQLYRETLIVFTSDHGEEFGEHGRIGWHSHSLYDELLRVPLIIKFPDNVGAGQRHEAQVQSLDIPPTVLSALGIDSPPEFSGVPLTPSTGGEQTGEEVGETEFAISRIDRAAHRNISSIRTERWKLYRNQLFDLDVDPAEEWDTAVNHASTVGELQQALDEIIAATKPYEEVQVVPSDSTLEELKALGYLQ